MFLKIIIAIERWITSTHQNVDIDRQKYVPKCCYSKMSVHFVLTSWRNHSFSLWFLFLVHAVGPLWLILEFHLRVDLLSELAQHILPYGSARGLLWSLLYLLAIMTLLLLALSLFIITIVLLIQYFLRWLNVDDSLWSTKHNSFATTKCGGKHHLISLLLLSKTPIGLSYLGCSLEEGMTSHWKRKLFMKFEIHLRSHSPSQ